MDKSRQTRELLAEQFHDLLLRRDFDKITIKQITDGAGVIRPTFYYHFQDKYAVLEYILCRDIIDPLRDRTVSGLTSLRRAFEQLERDRIFYRKAFQVTGQNSFEDMVFHHLREIWLEELKQVNLENIQNRLVTPEMLATYYALNLATILRFWIVDHQAEATAEEVLEAYEFALSHSIFDIGGDRAREVLLEERKMP